MDGVLVNFNEPKALERFDKEKGFFANLKPLYNNYEIVNALILNGENVYILSASPNRQADKDKKQWLKKYIPNLKRNHIIFCRTGEDKSNFIKDIKKSVLIDDYTKNCVEWTIKGGIAYKYINGTNNKTKRHKDYGIYELWNFENLIEKR